MFVNTWHYDRFLEYQETTQNLVSVFVTGRNSMIAALVRLGHYCYSSAVSAALWQSLKQPAAKKRKHAAAAPAAPAGSRSLTSSVASSLVSVCT